MKVTVKHWHAIAQWRWDTGSTDDDDGEGEHELGVCTDVPGGEDDAGVDDLCVPALVVVFLGR